MATETQKINWMRDFDGAITQAASSGKRILLDFTAAPM